MNANDKIRALVDAYIEACEGWAILDTLTNIFEESELEELGYGDFIRNLHKG